jgi:transketolase
MHNYKIEDYQATKEGFGKGILEMAKKHPQIIGLGSDITGSVGMNYFANEYPNRFYSLGIAEQNAVGVATGMALSGLLPVFSTYGVFAAMRTLDQIRISLCYNNVHAIIGGAHAGISVGPDGATHQALEDIAALQALPNMTVLNPCDANECSQAVRAAVEDISGPVYIRFGRAPIANFTDKDKKFTIGKAEILTEGSDISIIATGHMVWEALEAGLLLSKEGYSVEVINCHSIKPLDKETILKSAQKTNLVICAEEHQKIGGLGSSVATLLSEQYPCKMGFISMDDSFGESGQPEELLHKYKMDKEAIFKKAIDLLKQ